MNVDLAPVLARLREAWPELLAAYAFGSRVSGTARHDSDLDLAVLLPGRADPIRLFELSGPLADVVGCPVDLLDLRSASTVMQWQVVHTGQRLWAQPLEADLFECLVRSEKLALDEARAPLIDDILRRGRVHA